MKAQNSSRKSEMMSLSNDEIALRAHQLWCQQGCPQGHDVDNWIEAERQLNDEYANRQSASTDARQTDLSIVRENVPYSAFRQEAPLSTKVAAEVIDVGRPASRRSKTSLDL